MLLNKVTKLIAKVLNVGVEKITLETHIQNDLGADSLDAVDLMMSIEEEFNVVIPDELAQQLHTVKDIVSFLENNK
jgi:acyl carrier protein